MRSDPLEFFDKVAKEAPSRESDEEVDAGEAALAGLAMGSAFAAHGGSWFADKAMVFASRKGSVGWPASSPGEFPTIKGTLKEIYKHAPDAPPTKKTKFLGLLPISQRRVIKGQDSMATAVREMKRMQPTVDSFIKEYDLANKGVKIQFKAGLGSRIEGGAHYDIAKKRVRLPRVDSALALHELGHAADFTSNKARKFWGYARGPVQSAALAAVPIALIAGDEIRKALPGTVDDKVIDFIQQNAPAIVGATLAATQLHPEGKATALALKHLRRREGATSVRNAVKKLLPAWGTYALATIGPIVGMAMARKYYNETKDREQGQEKTSGFIRDTSGFIRDTARSIVSTGKDVSHVGRQIAHGSRELMEDPNRSRRIISAAKHVGTSPEFIQGALYTGIPAALSAAYMYGTSHGPHVRKKMEKVLPADAAALSGYRRGSRTISEQVPDEWKERNPGLYAGLVGMGAAMSGGIIFKLFTDLINAV